MYVYVGMEEWLNCEILYVYVCSMLCVYAVCCVCMQYVVYVCSMLCVCVDMEGFVEWTHCGREETQDKGRCLPHRSTGELPHRIHETEVLIHTYTYLYCMQLFHI